MDIKRLEDWKTVAKGKEALHYKRKYERTVRLCKAIWEERGSIECIKLALSTDCELEASEAWNELDYPVQNLLITAPRFGGPFTTKERAKITELWEISIDDLEAKDK